MLTFCLFLALPYVSLTIYTSYKIGRSTVLSRRQKIANGIINALLPLLWYFLVKPIIFPKHKLITRDEREKMNRMDSGIRLPPTPGSTTGDM